MFKATYLNHTLIWNIANISNTAEISNPHEI